eukprot:7231743-Prymnesium_polylepis.2
MAHRVWAQGLGMRGGVDCTVCMHIHIQRAHMARGTKGVTTGRCGLRPSVVSLPAPRVCVPRVWLCDAPSRPAHHIASSAPGASRCSAAFAASMVTW